VSSKTASEIVIRKKISKIKLFPNPKKHGVFNLNFVADFSEVTLSVVDLTGHIILKSICNQLAFKVVMFNEGQRSEDKIHLQESRGRVSYSVTPAKLGHVMLLEYNRKKTHWTSIWKSLISFKQLKES